MKKWIPKLILLVAIVGGFFLLKATVFKPEPILVAVAYADRGVVESTVTNSRAGTVQTRRRAKLSPEIGGQVVEIPFREGDRVQEGDTLSAVAATTLGSRSRWKEIWKLNRTRLPNPDVLPEGLSLKLPER